MIGRFVAFEGGEASGKSTQAERLANELDAVLTREPGGTPIGSGIRHLLLDPGTVGLDHRAEALLMAADRAQHVAEVIRPALLVGRHVVSDRFAGSSIAYQAYGRGLSRDDVAAMSVWAAAGLVPDLVVVLDLPVSVSADRLGTELDRFEREGAVFHERVRQGFLAEAEADPDRWAVLDGSASPDAVAEQVRAVVAQRLQLLA